MQTDIKADKLLESFNSFFEGDTEAEIVGNRLEITIGSQTMIVSLPKIIGTESTGQSQQS